MEEMTKTVRSYKTGRKYAIKRHYDCQSFWLIYSVICSDCHVKYVGQTIKTMDHRHYGHRIEVRTGVDVLGQHFVASDLTSARKKTQPTVSSHSNCR